MPCTAFKIGDTHGIVCFAPKPIKLMRGVWMEFHSYHGPSFWRDKNCTRPIYDWARRPRIVAEFDRWMAAQKEVLDIMDELEGS